MTSVLRLHDATNAYLSMKHDVAMQAANEMVLKEIDKYYFDYRISLAVVTTGGEEGSIDVLAKSGMWPGDLCAPRIFAKATRSALQPELEALERKGRLHALLVEECPITVPQVMCITLLVICWEPECASRTDGGRHRLPIRQRAMEELAFSQTWKARQRKVQNELNRQSDQRRS